MDFQDQLKIAVNQQQSQEEERIQLRVALALSLETNNDDNDNNNNDNPTATMQQPQQQLEETWKQPKPFNIADFHAIMWGPTSTDNDKARWVGQGIDTQKQSSATTTTTTAKKPPPMSDSNTTSRLTMVGADHGAWGLIQDHGGPCGVLAAIQAELLRLILFGKRNPISYTEALNPLETTDRPDAELSKALLDKCLAQSIAVVLARAAVMPPTNDNNDDDSNKSAPRTAAARVVLPKKAFVDSTTSYDSLEWQDLKPWTTQPGQDNVASLALGVYTIPVDNSSSSSTDACVGRLTHELQLFLQSKSSPTNPQTPLDCFRKPGGVILLVMSLVCSRGSSVISNDMDDPSGTKLTSQFGHCGQELMNLLLTGQAVSNVFDNTMTVSGAFTCRGIQSRPAVGYLSQLEALRYCEVGGYYKSPKFPIWVVGSTSHFTVMFGDASSLKESKSDELLERCRRAFKEVDGEENGFISRIHLAKVFELLDLNVGSEHAIQTLAATLEVSGADIILWDDFWKVTSRLLMGATLDSVLQGDTATSTSEPAKMLTLHGEPSQSNQKAAALTDEELAAQLNAKELEAYQQENDIKDGWKEMVGFTLAPTAPAAAMSDEEYARKLQAQWDAEATTGVAVVEDDAISHKAVVAADDVATLHDDQETKTAADGPFFEKFGNTFPLYHYNGMRGGTLTPFRVTRLSPEEAVGASIALGANGGGTGQSGGGGDLEDVVRTKWPSCMVNWLGKAPPYID